MSTTYAVGQRLTASLLQTLADGTVNKGVTRLIQQATQSLNDNTDTAITFGAGSEDVDTGNWHDEVTNNTRITPSQAGYCTFRAVFYIAAAADYVNLQVYIKKNGATILPASSRQGPNATSSSRSIQIVIGPILMNGSTDFVEVFGNQDNTASAARSTTSSGGTASCLFEAIFERPS